MLVVRNWDPSYRKQIGILDLGEDMKIKVKISVFFIILCGMTGISKAELIDNGNGTITEKRNDGSQLMWLKDANYAATTLYHLTLGYDADYLGGMYWADAMNWADNLVFAGYDDWRLPSSICFDGSSPQDGQLQINEMGYLYKIELGNPRGGIINKGPFVNLMTYYAYWSSTEYVDPEGRLGAWVFSFAGGGQTFYGLRSYEWAWAVRDVTPSPVPEPASILLLGSGLLGITGLRKKLKK